LQTLLQQFQQQRNQLMNRLQAATDAQRQQVLQQLEQVRDQLQSQLQAISAQARDQALDMRGQFGGHFAPGNSSGGGPASSGHGGKPRP
jgi:type II secretory pathway pseudopilin PulG